MYRFLFAFLLLCHLGAATNVTLSLDHADGLYAAGSQATVTCVVDIDGKPATGPVAVDIADDLIRNRDQQRLELVDGRCSLPVSGPGHVVVRVRHPADAKKATSSIGMVFDPAALKPSLPAPADFDAFWTAKKEALAAIPMDIIKREPVPWPADETHGLHVEQVTIRAWGDTPVVGILAYPENAEPASLPAKLGVYWAGVYGAEGGPKWMCMGDARKGYLSFHINAHGIDWLQNKAYYDELNKGALKGYAHQGKSDREHHYLLGMYLRIVRAIDFIASQKRWNGTDLVVTGTSQGGGQAIVAAGIDKRVTRIVAVVPAMCDHTAIVAHRSPSWPRLNNDQSDPVSWEVSRYFDASNFAARATAPAIIGVGLIDTTCPAGNVIAMYNQYGGKKLLVCDPHSGHRTGKGLKAGLQAARQKMPLPR